ncbi:hypothetical protein MCC10029_1528 [Bifidobacterium longum subsp. longum]|nr:hypothetical protein MCC10029_1528 [Bifidobacterium longum subsp. longum]
MLIPSPIDAGPSVKPSLSRRVNANSQHKCIILWITNKLIKKGEC